MVIICAAPSCSTKKDGIASKTAVQFHKFPLKKQDLCVKWAKAMRRPNFKPSNSSYLCSAHFLNSDYETKSSSNGKILKPNAVPSVFEKRRPGRKKKVLAVDCVQNAENGHKSSDSYNAEKGAEEMDEEFSLVEPNDKIESNLAEIIGDRDKGTLQVLIVGEDGKITNSEYIFKKELLDGDGLAIIPDEFPDNNQIVQVSHESLETENCSAPACILKMRKLKTRLKWSRKKIEFLQMKCKKINEQNKELRCLLKLLILKKGKGEKNLAELLEESERYELDDTKIEVKEEDLYIQN